MCLARNLGDGLYLKGRREGAPLLIHPVALQDEQESHSGSMSRGITGPIKTIATQSQQTSTSPKTSQQSTPSRERASNGKGSL